MLWKTFFAKANFLVSKSFCVPICFGACWTYHSNTLNSKLTFHTIYNHVFWQTFQTSFCIFSKQLSNLYTVYLLPSIYRFRLFFLFLKCYQKELQLMPYWLMLSSFWLKTFALSSDSLLNFFSLRATLFSSSPISQSSLAYFSLSSLNLLLVLIYALARLLFNKIEISKCISLSYLIFTT